MHLYVATKGIKHEVDQFITELQGKYLPMKYRDTVNDKWEDAHVQLSVRPIQLWEIGFPEDSYDLVANTILGGDMGEVRGNDGKKPVVHKWANKFIVIMRKLLHLDPLKPYKTDKAMPIRKKHMMIIGLGTKKDYTLPSGVEGI